MTRDLFGFDQPLPREAASPIELTLAFHDDGPLSIEVSDPAQPGSRRINLPKSQIDYRPIGKGAVEVSIPEWLARKEGLI